MTSKELSDWLDNCGEIRECPFCGKPDPVLRVIGGVDGFRDRYCFLCDYDEGGCGAAGGLRHYPEEALTAWNRRKRKWKNDGD